LEQSWPEHIHYKQQEEQDGLHRLMLNFDASSPRRAGQSEVFNGFAHRAKRLFD